MRWGGIFGVATLLGGCLVGSAATAADWQIAAVSGKAFRLDGSAWVAVAAGEPLALGDTLKTLGSGTLTLSRAGVTVTVGPNSRVQVAERMDGKFTDVFQTAGSATVEVDPAKHIRLAVETPYMAAVVKGTVFAVSTFEGHSETAVQRGRVAVVDVMNRLHADITAGQQASSGPSQPLSLSGSGALSTPQSFAGKVASRAADGTLSEMSISASAASSAGTTASEAATGKAGSNAGGNGAGNSESSHAGGNANSGGSGNGNSGNGNSGSGNSGNGSSGNGNSGNSGGNGNSGGSSSEHSHGSEGSDHGHGSEGSDHSHGNSSHED